MHDINYIIIKDKYEITLKNEMIFYSMPVPHEWQNESKMTIFD